jgi:transcriptional regulator with XRE-family HTH domain
MENSNTANILSVLDSFTMESAEDVSKKLADDFRQRRIEKNLTRKQIAAKAKISLSNVTRFEQKGLISLNNLIALAVAVGYTHEMKSIFESPKYATMEELTQIRHNMGKKRAYNSKR